ncbi:MAG: D-2-hydroxyacid dehydrogenase [Vicinamibacterales bacterium]
MPTLLILAKHAAEYRRLIEAERLPELAIVESSDVADGTTRAPDASILFGDPFRTRDALARLPALRWVQLSWAGVEPLLAPDLRRDYLLTNIRGVFGPLMAEYVFAYALAHERRLLARYQSQLDRVWNPTLPGTLQGKLMGLMGVGSIGADVARTAKHFGMRVRGYTRDSEACAAVDEYFHGDARHAFADGLDYLVAILPNTSDTRRLVDAPLLARLPPHAVFINGGRGSVVDEAALVDALTSGRLAGAVLDVFPEEPLAPDHVFWSTPNVLITSHTAAPSFPADMVRVFADNYRRFVRGEPLLHRVDFERGY